MTPYPVNSIGFFQFDNLVKNRVPFALLTLDASTADVIAGWYKGVFQLHIHTHSIPCTIDNVLAEVGSRKLSPHIAFVVIDASGDAGNEVAQKLEESGQLNVYVVRGGLAGLIQDRAAELAGG